MEKIAAAAAAKRDPDFLLIARTDARAVEISRGGRSARRVISPRARTRFFPEALQNEEEFRDFAREVKAPLLANMTEFGKSPLLSLENVGRSRLSHGDFPAERFSRFDESDGRISARFEEERHARRWLDRMQTRKELYEMLDYDPTK